MDSAQTTGFAAMDDNNNGANTSRMTAPIQQVAPIQDTSNLPFSGTQSFLENDSNGNSSTTRIEGMDALARHEQKQLTDAEKQMRDEELSFYSASDNDHGDDNIWGLLSGVGGNIYEWYVAKYCWKGMLVPEEQE